MAQRVSVKLVDDLDGSEATGSVQFGLDGATFEIDLSAANADALHAILAPFVANARRRGTVGIPAVSGPRNGPARPATASAIREWTRRNALPVIGADRRNAAADPTPAPTLSEPPSTPPASENSATPTAAPFVAAADRAAEPVRPRALPKITDPFRPEA